MAAHLLGQLSLSNVLFAAHCVRYAGLWVVVVTGTLRHVGRRLQGGKNA